MAYKIVFNNGKEVNVSMAFAKEILTSMNKHPQGVNVTFQSYTQGVNDELLLALNINEISFITDESIDLTRWRKNT